jgi:L-rhamnose isomerase/sugar isomerase
MLSSSEAIASAFARALLVDREALCAAQEDGDAMLAFRTLRTAYDTDVRPLLAKARAEKGGAIDWLETFRASRWRAQKAMKRKPVGLGAGIV